MKALVSLAWLALACAAVSAAEPDAKKFTPEIHGVLTRDGKPAASNVCLRQSGSEIRSCGYADASGHFFIPSSGPLHSVQPKANERGDEVLPTYWLETGNVQSAEKLWPIDPSTDRLAAIELDCDLSRPERGDSAYRSCEMKAATPRVVYVPRDDTPYRMARPIKDGAK